MTIYSTIHPSVQSRRTGSNAGFIIQTGQTGGEIIAYADTEAEAHAAKRAFELVLAPRFTRDEAIALFEERVYQASEAWRATFVPGIRLALEALAAAGVFSDGRNMADRLDAAGIR